MRSTVKGSDGENAQLRAMNIRCRSKDSGEVQMPAFPEAQIKGDLRRGHRKAKRNREGNQEQEQQKTE